MEIKVLTLLNSSERFRGRSKGMNAEEIVWLEDRYNSGKPFPAAFRELLFIGGKYDATSTRSDKIEILQDDAIEMLADTNNVIERPFIVFNGENACNEFEFIYLDEMDEDPEVYIASPGYTRNGEPLIAKMGFRLSKLINDNMYLKSKNLPTR